MKIYCLFVDGVSLTSRMANVLFDEACLMLARSERRKPIKDLEFQAELRTSFKEQCFGSLAGVEFRATIETESGTGDVTYIVRPIDAEFRNTLQFAPDLGIEDLFESATDPVSRNSANFN